MFSLLGKPCSVYLDNRTFSRDLFVLNAYSPRRIVAFLTPNFRAMAVLSGMSSSTNSVWPSSGALSRRVSCTFPSSVLMSSPLTILRPTGALARPRVILQSPKPPHFFFALPIVTVIEILGRIGILSCPAASAFAFLLAPVVLGTNDDNEAENSMALIVNSVITSSKIRFDIFSPRLQSPALDKWSTQQLAAELQLSARFAIENALDRQILIASNLRELFRLILSRHDGVLICRGVPPWAPVSLRLCLTGPGAYLRGFEKVLSNRRESSKRVLREV